MAALSGNHNSSNDRIVGSATRQKTTKNRSWVKQKKIFLLKRFETIIKSKTTL